MENLATDVEKLIKDTAKRIFFAEGKLHATTQDIADAAGINRASIHYYYRSRQILFDKVFEEAMAEFHSKQRAAVVEEEIPFRQWIGMLVDLLLQKSLEHPYLELFLVVELNTNPDLLPDIFPDQQERTARRAKLREFIAQEVANGTMKPIEPEHFIVTLMSLCIFPSLGKPMVKKALDFSEDDYTKFIAERKEVILKQIFLDL